MFNDFNAVGWISNNYAHVHLEPETESAVVNFSLMWNVFEGQFLNNYATVGKLEELVGEYEDDHFADDRLIKLFLFYRKRYVQDGTVNEKFQSLNFRSRDRKEFVEEVILNHTHITKDVVLASLIIVYRIRNNLFHGLKSFHLLNDQKENLNAASYLLSIIMECFENRF